MEKIESALSQSESDLSCLAKAYESLHAEASSFLSLGLQWQEIEEHLDSTRTELLTRLEELRVREGELDEREKKFEARAEQASGIENLEEFKEGKKSVRLLIHESNEELENRSKSFEEAGILLRKKHGAVEEVEKLIRDKEEECDSVENRVREAEKKLSEVERSVEKVSKEIECKEMELGKAEGRLNECCDDIEWKEKQLFDMEWDIEKNKKEYYTSVGKLKWAQNLEEKCIRKLEMKKERVKSVQRTLTKYADDLELKESRVKEVDVKVKEFSLHKKEMEEWSLKLEAKQKEVEGLAEKLESTESCFEAFRPRVEELHLIEERVGVCVDEVQLKLEKLFHLLEEKRQEGQKHLDGLEKSVKERSHELERKERRLDEQARGLELKERRLEEQASELELKEQEINSILKAAEEHVKSKEKTDRFSCVVKIEQLEHNPANNDVVPLRASNHLSINRDGRGLQLFMNEHLKRVDSVARDVSALLQGSVDPAGLVLEAMQGFYPTSLIRDNSEADVDLRIIRRSCIILLQQLKSLSPKISSQLRDEAMKLAANWKTKMTVATENRLEVLGFLRLVTTYELTSTYDAEELQSLLAIVSRPEQAADMFQAFGITDKAPGTNIMSSLVKIEEPGSPLDVNTTTIPPPKFSSQIDMLASLLSISTPAEHVLYCVHDSFDQYWTTGDVSFKEGAMLSNIFLLQCLIIVSPPIGRQVKKYAKRLADRWRAEMKGSTENAFDSLGFLLFTSAYELASRINIDETIKIFELISQNAWALKKCQTYGFPDHKNADDFIRNLIKKKQLIQAVGFIRTFKLLKYQPVPLLKEYVDDARKGSLTVCSLEIPLDEKIKLLDSEIADLRAVCQCVQHYHLESEYSPAYIEMEVVQVQNLKELLRRLAPSVGSNIVVNKQEQRKRKKTAHRSTPEFKRGQPPS